MELTEKLKRRLYQNGARLVGIGNMRGIENCNYSVGVSIAIPLPKHIIYDLQTAPTKEYFDMYYALNGKLNEIVTDGERFLHEAGYEAYAQTTERVVICEKQTTAVPHKTVATRAGLGWIGKNCLIVTKEFGSAVRLSSLLTNAPLKCGNAIEKSLCGACTLCVRNCPAQALCGTLWDVGIPRENIIDVEKCYKKQIEIMFRQTGIEQDLCGRCFATCAYTVKYIRQARSRL